MSRTSYVEATELSSFSTTKEFCDFLQCVEKNISKVSKLKPPLQALNFFSIHYALIMTPFDTA